jgi:hypothetical protein
MESETAAVTTTHDWGNVDINGEGDIFGCAAGEQQLLQGLVFLMNFYGTNLKLSKHIIHTDLLLAKF